MAQIGVIGDPHGNVEALTAVLRELDRRRVERVLCVGDLVGYNADPNQVVAELTRSATCIAGNHDRMALGVLDTDACWYGARFAVERTRATIDDAALEALSRLPTTFALEKGLFMFHGCIDDVRRYCRGDAELIHNERLLAARSPATWLACFGHTHAAGVHTVRATAAGYVVTRGATSGRVELDYGARIFLNPGSVDGARREHARAQFAVLDTFGRTVELCEVAYDGALSELKARSAGYRPPWHHQLRGEAISLVRRAHRDERRVG